MSPEQWEQAEALSNAFLQTLARAVKSGDPAGPAGAGGGASAPRMARFLLGRLFAAGPRRLGADVVDDERFTAYYDRETPGTARFLRDAVLIYTAQKP
jgi:hypothetical protein